MRYFRLKDDIGIEPPVIRDPNSGEEIANERAGELGPFVQWGAAYVTQRIDDATDELVDRAEKVVFFNPDHVASKTQAAKNERIKLIKEGVRVEPIAPVDEGHRTISIEDPVFAKVFEAGSGERGPWDEVDPPDGQASSSSAPVALADATDDQFADVVKASTIGSLVDQVGDDVDLAKAVIAAEETGKQRSGLISQLQELVDAAGAGDETTDDQAGTPGAEG